MEALFSINNRSNQRRNGDLCSPGNRIMCLACSTSSTSFQIIIIINISKSESARVTVTVCVCVCVCVFVFVFVVVVVAAIVVLQMIVIVTVEVATTLPVVHTHEESSEVMPLSRLSEDPSDLMYDASVVACDLASSFSGETSLPHSTFTLGVKDEQLPPELLEYTAVGAWMT